MACIKATSEAPAPEGAATYATEGDCTSACGEGACCEGTTCTVKPQCQCQGAGKVFQGIGTTCSPNPCIPCGCASDEGLETVTSAVIDVSFSGFAATQRYGTSSNPGGCDCESQYGFPGFLITQQTDFLNAWSAHFNSIAARLTFARYDNETGVFYWRGHTDALTKPGGGTATYYFVAVKGCAADIYISRDDSGGCQDNTGFANASGAVATSGPMAFAPGTITPYSSGGDVVAQCGSLAMLSQFSGTAVSQVFCAGLEPSGCFGAANCGSSYFRVGFIGAVSATMSQNPLP